MKVKLNLLRYKFIKNKSLSIKNIHINLLNSTKIQNLIPHSKVDSKKVIVIILINNLNNQFKKFSLKFSSSRNNNNNNISRKQSNNKLCKINKIFLKNLWLSKMIMMDLVEE